MDKQDQGSSGNYDVDKDDVKSGAVETTSGDMSKTNNKKMPENNEEKMPENDKEKLPENTEEQRNCEKVDFTSNEDISAMQPGQSVELIGFVDEVEASHLAGSHFVFKFLLNINDGKRVQIAAWREEVERTEALISTYKIIYLEGAKTQNVNNYTSGNVRNVEVHVINSTIIQVLGIMDKNAIRTISFYDSNVEYPMFQLKNIQGNFFPTILRTCGYLKTAFSVKKSSMSTRNEAFSYVTDGDLKLEIKVLNYTDCVLKQGDHVEVIGTPKVIDNSLVLQMDSVDQIRKINEETKPLVWLLRGKNSIPLSEYNKRQKLN